ncbi:MAG: DUF441 domain-containing protein [Clostridia bacterium]|nr:DUF441 domain-containing protein [Clostridia bacterium]
MNGETVLVSLILIGLIGKSSILATAACILLIMKLLNLQAFFPLVERRGLEIGLLFLMLAVLVPFAKGKISGNDILSSFTTLPGLFALLGGALATFMNKQGLTMLKLDPELMVGLVIGSIIGIIGFGGIPVGPLMAAGLTAFFLSVVSLLR